MRSLTLRSHILASRKHSHRTMNSANQHYAYPTTQTSFSPMGGQVWMGPPSVAYWPYAQPMMPYPYDEHRRIGLWE